MAQVESFTSKPAERFLLSFFDTSFKREEHEARELNAELLEARREIGRDLAAAHGKTSQYLRQEELDYQIAKSSVQSGLLVRKLRLHLLTIDISTSQKLREAEVAWGHLLMLLHRSAGGSVEERALFHCILECESEAATVRHCVQYPSVC